jgi:bifunctional NMN adenylyltransferase/nudix hydrolase
MNTNTTHDYDLGVIVGRFQTPKLHESHKKLFDYVCSKHEKVICYLGLAPIMGTIKNPLDFNQRSKMINEDYPNVQCFYIKDTRDDALWCANLDNMISDVKMPSQTPLLYGSRDSFISAYKEGGGKFDVEELESDSFISATQVRRDASRSIVSNYFVRLGMVLGSLFKYPTAFCTVDVAIMDNKRSRILLGRKPNEDKYRFIGGFSDPNTLSLEDDCKREVMEETHIEISQPEYLMSTIIDDWRYKNSADKIKTTFWIADRIGGDPQADDDIAELQMFDVSEFIYEEGYSPYDTPYRLDKIIPEHRVLMTKLLNYLEISK